MREIQMHPPEERKPRQPVEVVRRLQYFANGTELLAWVGPEQFTYDGRAGYTNVVYASTLADGAARPFALLKWWEWDRDERTPDPLVSSDCAVLVYEWAEYGDIGSVDFLEIVPPNVNDRPLRSLPTCRNGPSPLALTVDGAELIAVRNVYEDASQHKHWAPDVVRFDMAAVKKPPVRYEEKTNPLTRQPYREPVYAHHWLPVMSLPHDKAATVALSADGKLLAVGGVCAGIHVADLKRKKVLASFPWEGRFLRDRRPVRVGFDPTANWVVMLANGRLFARPLGAGKPWQTRSTLGYVHDFAFHPDGKTLAAVFRDGQARYLDPLTGRVRQSFKWAKKPAPLYSVAFSPDGLTCAAGGENGRVVIWDVDA